MQILLFGTGDYYRKYREWFRQEDIAGLIDNDENRQGIRIDGYMVYPPREAVRLPHDCIVILSVHEAAMRRQLIELGEANSKIYIFSELYNYPELTVAERPICFWGTDKTFSEMMENSYVDAFLLMSHNLDLNGAALALFYLAQVLVKNGYAVVFASWSDGVLRQYLYREKIPVIIDPNLQMKTQREVAWSKKFHRMICNTLNYYQFLSDRNRECKVIWWLHDPLMFYQSLHQELLYRIKSGGLTVCAVGPIAKAAFKEYFPDFAVEELLYGIPNVSSNKQFHTKIAFITIGNIQEYKGQKILMQALKKLDRAVLEQIHVRVVGFRPSAYANDVKTIAESMDGVIELLPPVNREEIHELLDRSDVLICPSLVDTMPVVVNEGMQHCLPCIVSDATGIAAYIKDGEDGFLVKQGDADELAEKIRWCVEHRNNLKQMGEKARRIYEKHFSMEVFEKNVMEIIGRFV